MRLPTYLYLGGMLLLLTGERILGGSAATAGLVLNAAGVLALLAALATVGRSLAAAAPDQKGAHRDQLVFGGVGLASLLVYLLSTDLVIDRLGLTEDAEHQLVAALQALWPILWLSGSLPFLAVDRVLAQSPVRTVPPRVREVALGWLSAAFALSALFPINYIASDINQRWDLGYFKTAEPGTATLNLIGALEDPITAYLFFPSSSDVTEEVRTYFDQVAGDTLAVEYVDHALEIELSKDLQVRDNGYIVLVRGEGEARQIERLKIGATFDAAKRNLKKLDADLYETLLKISRGPRVAYVVVGHGEMYWKNDLSPERRINDLKKAFTRSNFTVKELGLAEGLGNEVPEDAALVILLSPTEPLLEEELASLDAYRRRGGKLLIALDPDGADVNALLTPVGIRYDATNPLAIDQNFIPLTRRVVDRLNLATNKFSTHESVTTLSRNSKTLYVATPAAGLLEKLESGFEEGAKPTITIRALEQTWVDLNRDLSFDAATEARKDHALAIASSGPGTDGEYRVIVTADATWLSDLALPLFQGNAYWINDSLAWLLEDAASAGTINDEKDVKIQHTREGQGWIFYSTSLFVPLAFFLAGLLRVRTRKTRS